MAKDDIRTSVAAPGLCVSDALLPSVLRGAAASDHPDDATAATPTELRTWGQRAATFLGG